MEWVRVPYKLDMSAREGSNNFGDIASHSATFVASTDVGSFGSLQQQTKPKPIRDANTKRGQNSSFFVSLVPVLHSASHAVLNMIDKVHSQAQDASQNQIGTLDITRGFVPYMYNKPSTVCGRMVPGMSTKHA